jgi:protein SCO1/2
MILSLLLAALVARGANPPPNPFDLHVTPLTPGVVMPAMQFVNQDGRAVRFSDFAGRTVLVGFVYTRCRDECPIITQKFGVLDRLLPRSTFTLVEVSIDPATDSPPVLAAYARTHGVRGGRWYLLTGKPADIATFVRSAGVSVIQSPDGDIIHNAMLLIVGPDGRLAATDQSPAWEPSAVAAEMEAVAGTRSSLLGRLDYALTNGVAQLCGGSIQTASGILDAAGWLAVIGGGLLILGWVRHRVFSRGE